MSVSCNKIFTKPFLNFIIAWTKDCGCTRISILFTSIWYRSSESTKIGFAPHATIDPAVAKKELHTVITSSFFLTPNDFKANTNASVPLFVDIQWFTPINYEKAFSNFST